MNVEVTKDEKDFLAREVKLMGSTEPSDALIRLTCAAITGLCHTSLQTNPSDFGAMAAKIAKAAFFELTKPLTTKEK